MDADENDDDETNNRIKNRFREYLEAAIIPYLIFPVITNSLTFDELILFLFAHKKLHWDLTNSFSFCR